MNRLAELADAMDPHCSSDQYTPGKAMEVTALLRSASKVDAGMTDNADVNAAKVRIAAVEAERDEIAAAGRDVVQDAERIMHEFGIHKEQQEQLVADARAERDAARGQLEEIHNILDWFCVPRQYPNSIGELATLRERLMTLTNDRYSHDRLSEMLSGGGVPTICHDCNGGAVAAPIEMRVRMLIGERDAALASLAEKQRAIDEAAQRWTNSSEASRTADLMMERLRPHATPAATVKTRTVTVIDPTDDAKQRVTYTDRPQGPPRKETKQ